MDPLDLAGFDENLVDPSGHLVILLAPDDRMAARLMVLGKGATEIEACTGVTSERLTTLHSDPLWVKYLRDLHKALDASTLGRAKAIRGQAQDMVEYFFAEMKAQLHSGECTAQGVAAMSNATLNWYKALSVQTGLEEARTQGAVVTQDQVQATIRAELAALNESPEKLAQLAGWGPDAEGHDVEGHEPDDNAHSYHDPSDPYMMPDDHPIEI